MNSTSADSADLRHVQSAHSAADTVTRLKAILIEKKLDLFADIDHAAGALAVGMDLRPTRLLVFGNARGGTPLMQSQQTIGLDLPLRILVRQDADGKVWLTWHPLAGLARQHGITDRDAVVHGLDDAIAAIAAAGA